MIRRTATCVATVLVLLVALTACQLDVLVTINVDDDGSGAASVEAVFDAAAVAALGDVAGDLRLQDLRDAGWTVDDPVTAADGSVRVEASRYVASAGDWQTILDQIAGPDVFRDVEVVGTDDFSRRTRQLNFDLDLRRGWELATDDRLSSALGEVSFGSVISSRVDERTPQDVVGVTLEASIFADEGATPSATRIESRLGDDPQVVRLESISEKTLPLLLRWIGIALGALCALAFSLAALGLVLERRASRLRPAGVPAALRSQIPASPEIAPARTAKSQSRATAAAEHGPVRLVIIEPLSVLYRPAMNLQAHVIPFVEHNRGAGSTRAISEWFDEVLVGSSSTASFWSAVEVPARGAAIDDVFVEMRQLRAGAMDFLVELQRRKIPVAVLTNDAAAWSHKTRTRDSLSQLWPWIVSSEAGALATSPGMFELLRRESGVAFEYCLYIDNDVKRLDAARSLGMRTCGFDPEQDRPELADKHPRIETFAAFFKRRL